MCVCVEHNSPSIHLRSSGWKLALVSVVVSTFVKFMLAELILEIATYKEKER